MGKRSLLRVAIFLAVTASYLSMPTARAQSLGGGGDTSCPSGIYSPTDGSCIGSSDQSGSQGFDQQSSATDNSAGGVSAGPGGAMGQGAVGAGPSMSQQYPGLASQGMNPRITNFYDRSGLSPYESRQQALYEAQQLAILNYTPPTEFQKMVRASTGHLVPVYGDTLFLSVPTTFAPLDQTPVPPDYVLGPGDQLVIRIWGQVNFNAQVTIDRSGAIYLPQVGSIHVAGLAYSQLQPDLEREIGRIFRNFQVDAQMGQLRSIQVFVVGQARRPGDYTLSSLSTLITAIFATGGPSVHGSLRDIQVRRNGQTITHFDLYGLLVDGDKSKDVPLLPGDVIFIPPAGPQAAIVGEVRNPAIYELKDGETIDRLIQFAGGLSPSASIARAPLERVDSRKNRVTEDVTLQGAGLNTPLRDGDILRVLPVSPEFENTVTLRGNVAEPGRFAWRPGLKLSDILPNTEALVARDFWERRNQLGIPGPEFKPEYAGNPDDYPRDRDGYRRVMQTNEGALTGLGVSGRQALGASQGFTSDLDTTSGTGASQNPNLNPDLNTTDPTTGATIPGAGGQAAGSAQGQSQGRNRNLANGQSYQTIEEANALNPPPGSRLSANAAATLAQKTFGMPQSPPRPTLNLTVPAPEIDWSYAVIERIDPTTLTSSLLPFSPRKLILDHDSSQDLALMPGDVVTVFSQSDIMVPQKERTKYVRLEGEFKAAGVYSVRPGETLRQLVIRAGGITPDAYLFGSQFIRESTREMQQQRLNDYISSLDINIDQSTIDTAAGNLTPQDSATTATEVASSKSLIQKFRMLRATGRIVLDIPPNATDVNSLPEMPLEDGDRFIIPAHPSSVNVVGSVYDQNSFLYASRKHLGAYLQLAGGATRDSDAKHAFVIRADGTVVSRTSENGIFGNNFADMRMNPGDTVVVPAKLPNPSTMRNFLNYSTVFSQLALGAAAIFILQ